MSKTQILFKYLITEYGLNYFPSIVDIYSTAWVSTNQLQHGSEQPSTDTRATHVDLSKLVHQNKSFKIMNIQIIKIDAPSMMARLIQIIFIYMKQEHMQPWVSILIIS